MVFVPYGTYMCGHLTKGVASRALRPLGASNPFDAVEDHYLTAAMLTILSTNTAAQFVSEASATLKRRAEGTAEDVWLKSNLYPDYYLNTFHFQVRPCSPRPLDTIITQQAVI